MLRDFTKKDDLLVKLSSMKLKDSYVAYPWEQKMMTFLPVSGSAMVFSLLVMPPALSPKARDYASVEQTSARAIAWLSAAQASGVPITFVNIQTEPLFMQVSINLEIDEVFCDFCIQCVRNNSRHLSHFLMAVQQLSSTRATVSKYSF